MAWTEKQKKEHSKRMKTMWAKKQLNYMDDKRAESERWSTVSVTMTDDQKFNAIARKLELDNVNHPKHYTTHPSGVECITITEHLNFCVGNAVKYLWRAGEKGDYIEDLKKAKWYIQREIERIENGTSR